MSQGSTLQLKLQRVASDDSQIPDLYRQQKDFERSRKYLEADLLKKQISSLRLKQGRFVKQSLRDRQQEQRQTIEKVHEGQLVKFSAHWDSTFREMQKAAAEMQAELAVRQRNQMNLFESELQQQLDSKFKESSELLALRKTEEGLAKREEYVQAFELQQIIEENHQIERSKYSQEVHRKIKQQLHILKNKQDLEMNSLIQKINQSLNERGRHRQRQLQKLTQKYTNVKKQLEFQHSQERSKVQKEGGLKNSGVRIGGNFNK